MKMYTRDVIRILASTSYIKFSTHLLFQQLLLQPQHLPSLIIQKFLIAHFCFTICLKFDNKIFFLFYLCNVIEEPVEIILYGVAVSRLAQYFEQAGIRYEAESREYDALRF